MAKVIITELDNWRPATSEDFLELQVHVQKGIEKLMAEITVATQRELRNEIETQFGNLLEMIMNQPFPYRLCAQINEAFTRYAGNAQILTENNKEEPQQL